MAIIDSESTLSYSVIRVYRQIGTLFKLDDALIRNWDFTLGHISKRAIFTREHIILRMVIREVLTHIRLNITISQIELL